VDLDLPAGDAHVVDNEAQQLLTLLEAELVEAVSGPAGELTDALAEAVVGGQLLALGDQLVALAGQRTMAGVDVPCPPLHLAELEQPGLVQVGEASLLGPVGVELARQAVQLGTEELVIGRGRRRPHCRLAGAEHLGA
jgi:hypothetical protein